MAVRAWRGDGNASDAGAVAWLALLPNWTERTLPAPNAGEVTVLPPNRSVTGRLDPSTLLHGSRNADYVGDGAELLASGNAVVVSRHWHDGATANTGDLG